MDQLSFNRILARVDIRRSLEVWINKPLNLENKTL